MVVGFLCVMLTAAGCSKNDETVKPQCEPSLSVDMIICNPLAPAPGATAQLTAQATGYSCTSLPEFEWQVQSGTLIDTTGISVGWIAPQEKGVYRVFVRASLGTQVDTMSTYVMVRDLEQINTTIRYTLYPHLILNQLLFLGSTTSITLPTFMGFHAYARAGGTTELVTKDFGTTRVMGTQSVAFRRGSMVASAITDASQYYRQQPISIIVFPYDVIEFPTLIAGPRASVALRWDENTYVDTDENASMFIWQQNLVGLKEDGTADLINIAFKTLTGAITKLTTNVDSTYQFGTWVYRYWRNVRPMFSPDQSKILYFVDSTQTLEPCIIPLSGQTPVIADRHMFKPDPGAKPGIFQVAGVKASERAVFEWDPAVNDKVAFVDNNQKLCILDITSEDVQVLQDVGKVSEFAWSSDGRIAAITEDGISIVSQAGIPDTVFRKEKAEDNLSAIGWSPDQGNPKLAFRMVRKGKSSADSYSALMICSLNDRRSYYATPRIAWATEPPVPYTYMRVLFEADNNGVYFPTPEPQTGGGKITLYRSY
jgi:hypothetical protein